MSKLYYSPEAKNDLIEIKEYIETELHSPAAAVSTIKNIMQRTQMLKQFPEMGAMLSTIVKIDTDYRFLVCENYIAFYRAESSAIYIDRVIYGKRDYISILFGELPQE